MIRAYVFSFANLHKDFRLQSCAVGNAVQRNKHDRPGYHGELEVRAHVLACKLACLCVSDY